MFNRSISTSITSEGKKMNKFVTLTTTAVAATVIATSIGAGSASANTLPLGPTTCSQYSNGTTVCSQSGHGKASTPTIKIHDVQVVSHKGKTEVTYETKMYKLPVNTSKRVYVGHNVPGAWKKGEPTQIRVACGTYGHNSYGNMAHHPMYFPDRVACDKVVNGKVQHWQNFNWNFQLHSWQNVVCHNLWEFSGHWKHRTVSKASLVLVRQFSKLKYTFSWEDQALGAGKASAYCLIVTSTGSVAASGTSAFGFTVTVKGYISVYAYSAVSATYLAGQQKAKIQTTTESKAASSVSISATGQAEADAQCAITTNSTSTSTVTTLTCESVYGPGFNGNFPSCAKNGTTTPPSDPSNGAPGGSAPPSGGSDDPGSNQCYNNADPSQAPVTEPAGTPCPPGYSGS